MAYSQFHDGFWTDPEIRGLSSDDKLILIWFITNPYRHYSGLYFFEYDSIAKQTGLSEKTVGKGIDTLSAIHFIKLNSRFSMVWVKKMARHEVIRGEKSGEYSEKQTKGIANHLLTLHKCPLIRDFLAYYEDMKIPYLYPIRQEEEEEEEKAKEKAEVEASPESPDGDNGDARLVYECSSFLVSQEYFDKLLTEYPALTAPILSRELNKMGDWLTDNPKKHKRTARGHIKNPKMFIRNWIERMDIKPGGDKAWYE